VKTEAGKIWVEKTKRRREKMRRKGIEEERK